MSAIIFASAYRQLRPAQKQFVDGYVADVEREANKAGERISLALYRAIPDHVVARSRGMLEQPMVVAAISERITDIASQNELTVHRVIKELMCMGFSSMGNYMEVGEDGRPSFDLTKCTPEQLAAIKSVKITESGDGLSRPRRTDVHIVLHDKQAALTDLAKYMGLLQPDNPFWRAETAKPVNAAALPDGITQDGAADVYARYLNG